MNLYFLVEGVAELKVYPIWIEYLLNGKISRSDDYTQMSADQYYIFNGGGAGNMIHNAIGDAIDEIASNPVFDYFVVVIDSENESVATRKRRVENAISGATVDLPANCQVQILVQQVCFETWLCGHIQCYQSAKASSNKNIRMYVDDYDVEIQDPEAMPANPAGRSTLNHLSIGKYHSCYLHHMLKASYPNIPYTKSRADQIVDTAYLADLIYRLNTTPAHLNSFQQLFSLTDTMKAQL